MSREYMRMWGADALTFVHRDTLPNAWRDTIMYALDGGIKTPIQGGSFCGDNTFRLQLPYLVVQVTEPGTRPLAPLTAPGIPMPTTDELILQYMQGYLMSAEKPGKNEQYTYGQYITAQLQHVLDDIFQGGKVLYTNQASITLGEDSHKMVDPPCLRLMDFKVVQDDDVPDPRLDLSVFFRSWDLYAGMPQNLGGLQLIKEQVAEYLDIRDGWLTAFSTGGHLYSYQVNQVERTLGRQR